MIQVVMEYCLGSTSDILEGVFTLLAILLLSVSESQPVWCSVLCCTWDEVKAMYQTNILIIWLSHCAYTSIFKCAVSCLSRLEQISCWRAFQYKVRHLLLSYYCIVIFIVDSRVSHANEVCWRCGGVTSSATTCCSVKNDYAWQPCLRVGWPVTGGEQGYCIAGGVVLR